MSATPNKVILDALRSLVERYPQMCAALPRGTAPIGGRGETSPEPPVPIRPAVSDWLAELEWTILQLDGRARLLLGLSVPWRRLADCCPICLVGDLWHRAEEGVVACGNPECLDPSGRRYRWNGPEEWRRLGEMLAAKDAAQVEAPV